MKILILIFVTLFITLDSQSSTFSIEEDIRKFHFNNAALNKTIESYLTLQQRYIQLNRNDIDKEELVLLKYQMQVFNKWFSSQLIHQLKNTPFSKTKTQDLFDQLPFILPYDVAQSLGIKPSTHTPNKFLDVKTLERTHWSFFKNWKNLELAVNYIAEKESAYFHGITLKTGDVIIGDTNTYGFELLGAMRDTPQTGNHSAIFVMMHDEGRLIPTVFDMHAGGIRATPLSQYFNLRVNSYLEVYRIHKTQGVVSPDWQEKIRVYFTKNLNNQGSYHFDFTAQTINDGEGSLTCTELIHNILINDTNFSPLKNLTSFKDSSFRIITQFGNASQTYIAPADYTYSSRFQMIGYVDMLQAKKNLLIKLNANILKELFETGKINRNYVLGKMSTKIKALNKIKTPSSLIGKILRSLTGLTVESFPTGDINVIALSLFFEDEIEISIKDCNNPPKKIVETQFIKQERKDCYNFFNNKLKKIDSQYINVKKFFSNAQNIKEMNETMINIKTAFEIN